MVPTPPVAARADRHLSIQQALAELQVIDPRRKAEVGHQGPVRQAAGDPGLALEPFSELGQVPLRGAQRPLPEPFSPPHRLRGVLAGYRRQAV